MKVCAHSFKVPQKAINSLSYHAIIELVPQIRRRKLHAMLRKHNENMELIASAFFNRYPKLATSYYKYFKFIKPALRDDRVINLVDADRSLPIQLKPKKSIPLGFLEIFE